jgi:hypothetical protein
VELLSVEIRGFISFFLVVKMTYTRKKGIRRFLDLELDWKCMCMGLQGTLEAAPAEFVSVSRVTPELTLENGATPHKEEESFIGLSYSA